ncbi:hypothetical protein [uncultured Photobacterium sp.]|uniref:hypothetical protein n=1 Tax=uncultured Photobacterium sp. TaxID=173973 RepID=UPI00261E029E|nr:hypothetical protein [uncultured Photobacterium sp.]
MKYKTIFTVGLVLVLAGCASNKTVGYKKESASSVNTSLYMLSPPKNQEVEAHTISQYVYRAAQATAKKGFKKFALINDPSDKESENIGVFMFNSDNELQHLKKLSKRRRNLILLGVFETEEYKDRRFIAIGSVPGAA